MHDNKDGASQPFTHTSIERRARNGLEDPPRTLTGPALVNQLQASIELTAKHFTNGGHSILNARRRLQCYGGVRLDKSAKKCVLAICSSVGVVCERFIAINTSTDYFPF